MVCITLQHTESHTQRELVNIAKKQDRFKNTEAILANFFGGKGQGTKAENVKMPKIFLKKKKKRKAKNTFAKENRDRQMQSGSADL